MMSTRPPNDTTGPLDHLAMRYLRQALDTSHPSDEPYVLSPTESKVIRRTKTVTLTLAGLLGVAGVLLLYWPQYIWPDLFAGNTIVFLGESYVIPLITILYGLLLIYIEVNLLVAINLYAVKSIMLVCQFPRAHDAQYERHLRALSDAALERNTLRFARFGIDPYLNMPRWGLAIFFLINTIRAALSSVLLRFLIRRFMGRYVLRQVTELAGMPIFAAWNMWASWQMIHEAQVRVMAPMTIREFVSELHDECGKDPAFKPLILDALQYVAILKRQYNYAHHLLTETLADRFGLDTKAKPTGDFLNKIAQLTPEHRRSLERLIVFGVLIDGRLSWLEKRRLQQLRKNGFLSYSTDAIQRIGSEYNQGRGLWV